ncbi:(Fe-S)-binding protein [Solimonas sp. K1W22B-7]|uniref:(Fe-S)-binding protein n=1 Tax=Solimonas sp. K1W22B-7 TaxID=2303331 RepID=UPI000E333F6E|nr:(Fe-S)-binding protein [Solimonas sp. K1W22B-7]AXQ31278.1 (Fe-S)-binding protein [Solimonas sp. K1W22B-7]
MKSGAAAHGDRTTAVAETVYFFGTCVIDLFSPESGLDAIDVLQNIGVRVEYPVRQTCCGQPAYTTGFPKEAASVAAAQLDLFPQPWPIVVPSGSCAGMLKQHWPRLFEGMPSLEAKAKDIAGRTVELTEFLVSRMGNELFRENAAPPIKIALHTSCSARREMSTHIHARRLIAKLPGVELVDHDHEAECCGFGGTFSVKHPDISVSMAEDKVKAVRLSGCHRLVSADCGCLLNLNGVLEKQGSPLRGEHLASFIRSRLGRHSENGINDS